jgi:hypothetical protein
LKSAGARDSAGPNARLSATVKDRPRAEFVDVDLDKDVIRGRCSRDEQEQGRNEQQVFHDGINPSKSGQLQVFCYCPHFPPTPQCYFPLSRGFADHPILLPDS